MMINENKIKLVTGVKRCYIFTMLHIPPKMFVYHNFRRKIGVSQNMEIKDGIWLEFKTMKENMITSDLCNVYCVPKWENGTNTYKNQ